MRARQRTDARAVEPAEPAAPRPASSSLREHLRPLLVVIAVSAVVAGFYFLLYPAKRYPMPIGWDTPRYLLQTTIVGQNGLTGVPSSLPPPGKTLASRAAFPVMVLSLSSLFTASTFKLAQTVPVAAAVATALAAGAFAAVTLRRKDWEFAVIAVVIGVSPVLIRLMAPETYTDNLFFTATVTAALVPILFVMRDGTNFVPAVLLLTAAAFAHTPFFAGALAVLVLVGLAFAPRSWRAWRLGESNVLSTPTGRLGSLVLGTGGLVAVGMFGLLRTAPDTPRLSPGELSKKLREDVGLYVFPVTVPLAAVGLGATSAAARSRSRRSGEDGMRPTSRVDPFSARFLVVVSVAWGAVVTAGLVAFLLGANLPAHRFIASLVPLPMAVALGILTLGGWIGSPQRAGWRRAGAAFVVLSVAGMAALGLRELYFELPSERGVEWIEYHKIQDTTNAVAYLDRMNVRADEPVVFVVDDLGGNPLSNIPEMAYILRSALPADRMARSWFYVGNPEKYLARQPTLRDHPKTYDANSEAFWRPLDTMLGGRTRPPLALLLEHFNPFYDTMRARHPDWVAAPGVIVLQGPRPDHVLPPGVPPWGMRTVPQGVALSTGTVLVLALVGLGWAVALMPAGLRSFEVLALGPAFGIASLILFGVMVDAAGARLAGWGGSLTVLLAAAVGWALAVHRLRRDGSLASVFPAR